MTATHLDYDTLADLAEELLDEEDKAAAESHLADCQVCRDRVAELAGVTRILAAARPPSMPPDLQVRLSAALEAEAMGGAPHRRRSHRHQAIVAAAAAVVVIGGVAAVAETMSGGSPLPSSARSEATTGGGPQVTPQLGAGPAARPDIRQNGPQEGAHGVYSVLDSGTAFTTANLTDQVRQAIGHLQPGGPMRRTAGAQLAACVTHVVGAARPLLVDEGTFNGAPADVIIAQNGAMSLDVWVVGSSCSGTDTDILTRLSTTR